MGDQIQEDLPTDSTQEVDPQDHDSGLGGRSYECIFCKRGLNSAQALGGHMNIHRKDRAKGRPDYLSTNNSNKQEVINSSYAYSRFHHPVFTSFPNHQEGNIRHTTYFSSTSSIVDPINHGSYHQDVLEVNDGSYGEEKMMSSKLEFGWPGENNKESKRRITSRSEDDEIDLELRLGCDR